MKEGLNLKLILFWGKAEVIEVDTEDQNSKALKALDLDVDRMNLFWF